MQQCTYNTPKKAQGTAKGPKKNNFDQFSTLKEADRIVVQRDARQDGRLNKNYSCVASCLKGGMQYQLCQTQCTQ